MKNKVSPIPKNKIFNISLDKFEMQTLKSTIKDAIYKTKEKDESKTKK